MLCNSFRACSVNSECVSKKKRKNVLNLFEDLDVEARAVHTPQQALTKTQAQKHHSGLKSMLSLAWSLETHPHIIHDQQHVKFTWWGERGKKGKIVWFQLLRPLHTSVKHAAVYTCSEDDDKFMSYVEKWISQHCCHFLTVAEKTTQHKFLQDWWGAAKCKNVLYYKASRHVNV